MTGLNRTTYFSSTTLTRSLVLDAFTSLYNGLMLRLNKEGQIIKYMSARRGIIKKAIDKGVGLYFKYYNVEFYIYPCPAIEKDIWVMEPKGPDNIDLMIQGESPYSKHKISWIYLNLHDSKYYWQLKMPWAGCWKCLTADFGLYHQKQQLPKLGIMVSEKVIDRIQLLTEDTLSKVLEGYSGYKFRCASCGESCPVAEIDMRYYLKMFTSI